jgi:glycosyltransferase involved in cell wall biosynthesis
MATTVSVLIPAVGAASLLPLALEGLRAQTHRTWELIVASADARDGSGSLLREFAAEMSQPVRHITLGENPGRPSSRNRLLEVAEGDLVAFLDPGDYWQPGHLITLISCLSRGGHSLVFSDTELWDIENRRHLGDDRLGSIPGAAPRRSLFVRSIVSTASCALLPRTVANRTGLFDESLRSAASRDFWFRALDGGVTLGCTGSVTCRHSWQATLEPLALLHNAEDTVRFHEKHYWADDIPIRLRRRLLADARWQLARILREIEPPKAAELGWQAWRATPLRPMLLGWCLAAGLRHRHS